MEYRMKKIGIVSIPRKIDYRNFSFEGFYEEIGMNSGNYMFTESMFRQLKGNIKNLIFNYDYKEINKNFDHIVIPAANWINSYSDWDWFCDIIEQTDVPVTVVGLGIQTDDNDDDLRNFKPTRSSVRFAKIISKKSNFISVRGDLTKNFLNSIGIDNVIVTGCPSLYMKITDEGNSHYRAGNLIIQPTRYGISKEFVLSKDVNRHLFYLACRLETDIIYQSELEEIMMILYGSRERKNIEKHQLENLMDLYQCNSFDLLFERIISKGHVFFDIEKWSNFVRKSCGVIGTRLHGCILSLNSNVPALLITHDSRTREIADFANIPVIDQQDVRGIETRSAAMDRLMQANLVRFRETRSRNGIVYRAFLAACDLPYHEEALFSVS